MRNTFKWIADVLLSNPQSGDALVYNGSQWANSSVLSTKVDKITGKQLSTEDYTSTEKSKLAGVATGATANSSDATLLARANHTGSQLASTISDFNATARGLLSASAPLSYNSATGAFTTADATQTTRGVMSATDKTKLDTLVSRVRAQMASVGTSTTGTTFLAMGDKFLWINSRNASYRNPVLLFRATVTTRNLEIRVYDATNAVQLGITGVITTSGIYTLAFDRPTADCVIEIQGRQSASGGTAPKIDTAAIEFDTIL